MMNKNIQRVFFLKVHRVNELINSRTYELIGLEGDEEDEEEMALNNPRPRIANRAQARFMHNMLREDHQRIDAMLARERRALEEFHQRSREHEQRLEAARAAENLPPGETSAVPSSSGNLSPGEIPDVPIEQETEEEQDVTQEKDEEVKIYQEELQCRKDMDIFAQTPTAQFMELLKPEAEDHATSSQKNLENLFVKEGIVKTNRPFQNKISEKLDRPLEPEPRVKIEVPKPEPKGEDHSAEDYECALDGLKVLDKQHKLETFGFYGKYFPDTHSNALNFVKFRKANPIAHPCAKFDIDEHALVSLYCELLYSTPTPEEFFYQKAITYTCKDHRLRLKEDEKMLERSMRSKEEFENKKDVLKAKVRQSDDGELGYDDLSTDLTELFLSGEDIPRNPESVGSSSKSITTLFWNLGNWNRGVNFRVPAELDYKKLHYKEMNQERYPDGEKLSRPHLFELRSILLIDTRSTSRRMVGRCASTIQQIFVVSPDWVSMEELDRLLDQTRRTLKTFGMVQNVVFPLQFLRSLGARPFLEVHLLFPLLATFHVKILKIMKK